METAEKMIKEAINLLALAQNQVEGPETVVQEGTAEAHIWTAIDEAHKALKALSPERKPSSLLPLFHDILKPYKAL